MAHLFVNADLNLHFLTGEKLQIQIGVDNYYKTSFKIVICVVQWVYIENRVRKKLAGKCRSVIAPYVLVYTRIYCVS